MNRVNIPIWAVKGLAPVVGVRHEKDMFSVSTTQLYPFDVTFNQTPSYTLYKGAPQGNPSTTLKAYCMGCCVDVKPNYVLNLGFTESDIEVTSDIVATFVVGLSGTGRYILTQIMWNRFLGKASNVNYIVGFSAEFGIPSFDSSGHTCTLDFLLQRDFPNPRI
ncbi:hypothetical protein DFH07DRAFT_763705 [Mycena maculata]|uniref:Uncharacterized protein n=1 Tax=Mycena maculata TaxID=230809 RepID=A0AAD7KI03_9AGAR|nr:hypothetical protein DFH07DRAFT_763705 [Mycena maculata]